MYAFTKSIRNDHHIRRFTIQSSAAGWEVIEEQDSRVVRQASYQDWHRVERARRLFVNELNQLQECGWREER
ncbi:MAG TPA: hypothetical protein VNJ02_16820 [Vicinamibacterales bacterium]|nr:hypothetical protein [Vicinamibacterales bacterium]